MRSAMPGPEQALLTVIPEVDGLQVRDRAVREPQVSSLRRASGAGGTGAQSHHSSLSCKFSPAGPADDKWSVGILLAGHEEVDSIRQLLKERLLNFSLPA